MPVFIVSRVDIPEPQALARYMADAPATVEAYGGRYIVRSNQVEPLEGDTTCDRVVVLEFPDGDRARLVPFAGISAAARSAAAERERQHSAGAMTSALRESA